jgi:ABC-type multidrug transport system permease subunit
MTVFKYAFRRSFNPVTIIANFALPLVLVAFASGMFEMQHTGPNDQWGFFLVAMTICVGSFYSAKSIQNDKMSGVLTRIIAGPITMRSYLVQNFMAAIIPCIALCLAVGGLGMAIHGWELQFAAALTLSYTMLAASSIGLSVAWSCLFENKESSAAVFTVLITFMSFTGGFLISLNALPDILYYGGAILPSHWVSRGIISLLDYGITSGWWLSILAMLLFTIAFLLYGGKRRLI